MNKPQQNTHPFTLLILAGGEGRRMGGIDKGLLDWQGKPLISGGVNAFTQLASQTVISCNRNSEQYARYGQVVNDELPGFNGPLAGIQSGLRLAKENWILVLPCDSPAPPKSLLNRLFDTAKEKNASICYAHDGAQGQYLFALINRNTLPALETYLAEGQRSVRHWYRDQGAVAVDFSDQPDGFKNLNTPEDLN
ncbi:molybdenum cofactor guanylyltransferase [Spongiibacter sp. KMU-158]|uniref:Molybdenum cofactor guanylyltransferase n=1 Tax=Spongiibacter pelagi TaxID=2760804 RepID=A0A927C2H6_9GAMM|nr:molybdenum cofactor guanylyltransferase MobA [Spongiibacter pelagi]MBD2858591.1 molybdenum cofactor guanylyltransferase [Spongiibacter pelagi]